MTDKRELQWATPPTVRPIIAFGPTDSEWCPNAPEDDPGHCGCWYECEPCHRCGDDTPDPNCDCDRCTAVRCTSESEADRG